MWIVTLYKAHLVANGSKQIAGRIQAFEQETRDLDVEIKKLKELKANYGVTTPQELSRSIMAEEDIDNLTMEQYLTLTRGNQAPGMVKPEIRGNVNFEIKSQFMRELKKDTFFENKNDDAHEHVERVLDIVSLFNIPGVTHDVVMLRVFPITLTGAAKSPPSKTAKQLKDIHNFKQESDKTLYQAWERYNDLLYKFPTHDINSHQKVNIFCNGLGTMNHQLLDSQGPIPGMTPAQTLMAIQNIIDHSQKWHDSLSSRNIKSSSSSEGIDAIDSKVRGAHLDKECPLNEEVKILKEVKYGEYERPFPNYSQNDRRFNRRVAGYGSHDQPSSDEKKPSLTELINKHIEEAAKRHAKQDERLRKFYQNVKTNRENHGKIIQGLETKVKTLTNEVEE
nr:hypothetical protein [Tanacetum cinerariifolium]